MYKKLVAIIAVTATAGLTTLALNSVSANAADTPSIVSRGGVTSATFGSSQTSSKISLTTPSSAKTGDVLVASFGIGESDSSRVPTISSPTSWTKVSRVDSSTVDSLAIYTHVLQQGETSFTFTTDLPVAGVSFLSAYGNVDQVNPIDTANETLITANATSLSTSSVRTSSNNSLLVATYYGHAEGATGDTWTQPSGMSAVKSQSNSGSRSALLATETFATAGTTGTRIAKSSHALDRSFASIVALRPATSSTPPTTVPPTTTVPPVNSSATPILIDTDLFGDADDAGALATAFGLQQSGEARVIGITLNTRTDRPAVATKSWKCAATIMRFYNSSSVPIGSDSPSNGTAVSDPDWLSPCASLAPTNTPAPSSAVTVQRKALAAEADHSVVIASAGYMENLAKLLSSGPDSYSSLSGQQLVAAKVRNLVIMGGGYPSRSGETNILGNIGAAQTVTNNWPTTIVWSGYEVGDAVHTGQYISSTHPSNSPVRVSYEAFVGGGNWIYSYDLAAVYAGVRPADSALAYSAAGKNVINSDGSNRFVTGSGNQYYLKVTNVNALDASINKLIDKVPTAN